MCGAYVSDAFTVVSSDPTVSVEGERGCVAGRDLNYGEMLLELPLECCLTYAPGAEDALQPISRELELAGIDPRDAALAVAFATEKIQGTDSPWWQYVSNVGAPPKTFPCFFDDKDLDALQSPALQELLVARDNAIKSIAHLYGLELDVLRSSWYLMASRRFGCEECRFMLPVGDFLNHSFAPSCAWEQPGKGVNAWKLKTVTEVKKGQPLTFCYCEDPNHLLLNTCGFIVSDNPFNRVMARPCDLRRCLAMIANPNSPNDFASFRMAEIEKNLPDPVDNDPGSSMFLVGRVPNGLQWNPLWLNLCGLAQTDGYGAHWSQQPGGTAAYLDSLEKASWALFSTTLEEDQVLLESDTISTNQNLAIQFRLGQKELIAQAISSLRERLLSEQAS